MGADGWTGLSAAARAAVRRADVLLGARRQLDLIPARVGEHPLTARRVTWPSPLLPALAGLLAEHGIPVAGTSDADTDTDTDAGADTGTGVDTGADTDADTGTGTGAGADTGTGAESGGDPRRPAVRSSGPGGEVCVLASGDPMFHGIGTTLVRLLGADRVRVFTHPSAVSLACARLGWAIDGVDVVSAVGRPLAQVHAALTPHRRLLVLSADGTTPLALADLLVDRGYGASPLTVLERLGAADEAAQRAAAHEWAAASARWRDASAHHGGLLGSTLRPPADLNVAAVEPRPGPGAAHRPRTPGLPDDAFEHDGQITKREIRAVTLARLGPAPGELLWDVGAGAGSIAIEWMRAHATCRAVAVEPRADRAERIRRNATNLGVPGLRVVVGRAPQVLAGLPAPDAVFVGGGATADGLLEACWAALRGRGRLVVNAVTLESEAMLAAWYARRGGDLIRLSVSRASPVGGFTGWRSAMPVTQWTVWPGDHAAAGDR
ncbi:precorrin-6y C5,15-methyltransferase (decarboxylating) subunit CbiE [Frankia sp. AiPs1]|uniref:precorrin-6y C5,15-methyltransferase (decarboxylating) subunit CbiE n=1 Tax=Frankia sp. AiPs1 TaxID=573493 RepID=UPI0035ABA48C